MKKNPQKMSGKECSMQGYRFATYNLARLLEGLGYTCLTKIKPPEVEVSSVTADSREMCRDALFIALTGLVSDGHDYTEQAIRNGCAAIIVEDGKGRIAAMEGVCVIEVADTRKVYAEVVAAYFNHPAKEMNFVGITGTNGKTTVTYLLESIFEKLSYSVGVIGTVNYRYRDRLGNKRVFPAPFTTPEPLILQKLLREMADEGVRYVLMEVSSHALAQERLGDVRYDVAAFTNLSHDHLDYHVNMDDYFSAKTRIFTDHLKEDGSAVIFFGGNTGEQENEWAKRMAGVCKKRGIGYIKAIGCKGGDVELLDMDARLDGTRFSLKTPQGDISVQYSLAGRFNVDNAMTAMSIALELGLDVHDIGCGLAAAGGAPGRLQHIMVGGESGIRPYVFVDYAHTPDALCKVLKTLKDLPHRDLICVFGCGGDRDKEKREVMGEIAAGICDVVIVTDDNPRSEAPEEILSQIGVGAKKTGMEKRSLSWQTQRSSGERGFLVHGCREEAISIGIGMASASDIVVIAGKGHEKYQLTREGKRFFDDCLEAREALISWDSSSILMAIDAEKSGEMENTPFKEVSTDSRSLHPDDIFIALQGETFDGHDFLEQAIAAGAGALVVSKSYATETPEHVHVFRVEDTQVALEDMARYRRGLLQTLTGPVVAAITGSCGKTTVKEMTAAIFEERWVDGPEVPAGRVLKTRGNFNNLIGLPLSLLPLAARHKAAILEMGMNRPGEIARLTEIAHPDISCIVNIHAAHLEGLQSIDGVARAKEELFAGSSSESILVVNLDDIRVRECAAKYQQKKISFTATPEGLVYTPDLWATDISLSPSDGLRFTLHIGQVESEVELDMPGEHNVSNSLAAAAIAHAAGIGIEEICTGLARFRAPDKRMVLLQSRLGYSVINDTYNANPASMAAGLATLEQLTSGTRVAILGDMLELGAASAAAHRELGERVVERGVRYLALVGEYADEVVKGALAAGMDHDALRRCDEKKEVLSWIRSLHDAGKIQKGDWLLVKASRGMRFETIVSQLLTDL